MSVWRAVRRMWRRWLYRLYLRTPHWRLLRRRALAMHGAYCHVCRSRSRIHVHHVRYRDSRGRSILWREKLSDLIPLCSACHAKEHKHA